MHHAKGVQIMLLKSRWIGNITAAVICIPANLYLYNCCFSENQHFTLKIKKTYWNWQDGGRTCAGIYHFMIPALNSDVVRQWSWQWMFTQDIICSDTDWRSLLRSAKKTHTIKTLYFSSRHYYLFCISCLILSPLSGPNCRKWPSACWLNGTLGHPSRSF